MCFSLACSRPPAIPPRPAPTVIIARKEEETHETVALCRVWQSLHFIVRLSLRSWPFAYARVPWLFVCCALYVSTHIHLLANARDPPLPEIASYRVLFRHTSAGGRKRQARAVLRKEEASRDQRAALSPLFAPVSLRSPSLNARCRNGRGDRDHQLPASSSPSPSSSFSFASQCASLHEQRRGNSSSSPTTTTIIIILRRLLFLKKQRTHANASQASIIIVITTYVSPSCSACSYSVSSVPSEQSSRRQHL